MKHKNKKNIILCTAACILTLISICVIYAVHKEIPFMMDDIWYSTKLSSEEPIKNFADIVESQIWHYFNWGGRSMTHALLQLTLLSGETAADILNVAVTLLLCFVICLNAGIKSGGGMPGIFAALSMLLGLNANWKMSMFWQAGAANYLYITVFIMLYLYCYLRELDDADCLVSEKGQPANKLFGITLWIIPLGILAGWSNENMGAAVWIVSLLVIIIKLREHSGISAWMILGNISCLFGSIMVIIAPGNFVRSAQIEENQYGLLWRCFLRGYAESTAMCDYLFPTVLLLVFVMIIAGPVLGLPIGRRNLLLAAAAILSWGAMVLSPHYPDRATFGTMVLLICVIISLMVKIIKSRSDLSVPIFIVNVLIWLRGMYFLGEYLAICWGWIQ